MHRHTIWLRYGFAWVTGALFLITLIGHWIFGWFAYTSEQMAHRQPSDDRMEAKIDAILLAVEPKKGDRLLQGIHREYEGRHTDARLVRELEKRAGDAG